MGNWIAMLVSLLVAAEYSSMGRCGVIPGVQARGAGCRPSLRALCAACRAAKLLCISYACGPVALHLHERNDKLIMCMEALGTWQ